MKLWKKLAGIVPMALTVGLLAALALSACAAYGAVSAYSVLQSALLLLQLLPQSL